MTFSVIVTPQANADAYSAALGTARVVDAAAGVLTNDSLNSAVLVSYGAPLGTEQATLGTATTTSQGGQVAVQADGSFTYTPAAGFTGADTFRYVVGNFSGSSTATVTFNVVAAPTASADSFEAAVNTLRTVSAAGVLANDTVNSAIISSFTATSVRGGVVAVANAYLRQQYKVVAVFFLVIFALLAWAAYGLEAQSRWVPFAFITGGFFSGLAGWFGMKTATLASNRTA